MEKKSSSLSSLHLKDLNLSELLNNFTDKKLAYWNIGIKTYLLGKH